MKKLTLHEKAAVAKQVAITLRSFAITLKHEAEMYDCKWPNSIIKDMEVKAEYYLKQLK